jgi:hypothetical protein
MYTLSSCNILQNCNSHTFDIDTDMKMQSISKTRRISYVVNL